MREEEEEGKEDAKVAEVWEDGGAGPVTGGMALVLPVVARWSLK